VRGGARLLPEEDGMWQRDTLVFYARDDGEMDYFPPRHLHSHDGMESFFPSLRVQHTSLLTRGRGGQLQVFGHGLRNRTVPGVGHWQEKRSLV
jgi:hypothetical protein